MASSLYNKVLYQINKINAIGKFCEFAQLTEIAWPNIHERLLSRFP